MALLAQLFSLAAIVVPIVAGLSALLPTVVLAAAASTIAVYPATLAVSVRLPSLNDPFVVRRVVAASLLVLLLFVVAGAAATAVASTWARPYWATTGLQATIMLAAQGLFMAGQALATQQLSYSLIARQRLIYGVGTFALTLLAVWLARSAVALTLAAAVPMAVAGLFSLRKLRTRLNPPADPQWSTWAWIRRSLPIGLALGVGNIATQSPALILPGLPPALAAPWAAVSRIGNGFLTVGASLLGPTVDVRFAALLQDPDKRIVSPMRFAIVRSTGLATVAAGGLGATLAYAVYSLDGVNQTGPLGVTALVVAILGFWLTQIFVSPIGRTLAMFPNGERLRVVYDAARVAGVLLAFTLLRAELLLLALGVIVAVCNTAYVVAVARIVRSAVGPQGA